MFGTPAAIADPVRVGLVGAGRIGTSHATLLTHRVPGARLVAIADPRPGVAQSLADELGCRAVHRPRRRCSPTPRSRRS